MRLHQAIKLFIKKTILPHALNKDDARREFILNILLVGLGVLAGIAFSINALHPFLYPESKAQSPLTTGIVLIFIVLLWKLSRFGKSQIAAHIFIIFLLLMGMYMSYYWGPDLPAVLLFYSLLIVMTGILINSSFAFLIAIACGVATVIFSYLELSQMLHPHDGWKREPILITDAVVYAIIFGIISIVSWLSNREMMKALRRARASELAVRKQRDNLEVIVEERTRELKFAQAEKLSQLYRFAEFGRMSTGLFHDLANPLTLVFLNLDKMKKQSRNSHQDISETKILLNRALSGTKRLEQFIVAARKQVQNQDVLQKFSLTEEVNSALLLLEYKSRKKKVRFVVVIPKNILYIGNSVRFNQLVTNIVSNAIDSYDDSTTKDRKVVVSIVREKDEIVLTIQDWGHGIHKKTLPHIFKPLFTTKTIERGMGVGLSICKDIVDKYLHGHITVESTYRKGTTFIVRFPFAKKSPKN